jgi:uncharacterized protein with HEPN domain
MSKRGDAELAQDMLLAIERARRYVRGLGYEEFLKNTMVQDAVVRNLAIVGEAAKQLSPEFRRTRKDVDWQAIAGMRDRLIHGYFGINWKIVWNVVAEELPKLQAALAGPGR